MKIPREILLARHNAVGPTLDKIRQDLVAGLNNKAGASRTAQNRQSLPSAFISSFLCCSKNIWLELVWPSRRIWAGLAAVWLMLLAANFSMRDHSEIKIAKSLPSPQVIMAFQRQQQLLSELIGPGDSPVPKAQRSYSPHPASERRQNSRRLEL
ncbi:MAG: hypothetical protein ACREFR_03915 [Limisphaerales bacterium]